MRLKPCRKCGTLLAPGSYCPTCPGFVRAPRLTGQEKAEAQRLAQETQARLKRQAWARREYRGVLEISAHRRWLYRRGELRAELDACVAAEVLTPDDADRLEAETADAVIEEAYARARREVEREAREAARVETSPDVIDDHGSKRFAFGYLTEPEPREEPRRHRPRNTRALLNVLMLGLFMGASPPGRDEG